MDSKKTRTGSVTSGIDATYKKASVLLSQAGSQMARSHDFTDVRFQNLGDTTLYVANMNTDDAAPTDADAIAISAGETVLFGRINTGSFYVKTSNAGGVNAFSIKGEPL